MDAHYEEGMTSRHVCLRVAMLLGTTLAVKYSVSFLTFCVHRHAPEVSSSSRSSCVRRGSGLQPVKNSRG